ncbi:MAG: methylated-DNA--[protein]-cysteine S-methyltransferase [Ardenticatenaceae bacterium]|nr:methylated-DNA--[protein]-cysteine S-methyltransferase [Ardenticatenaceae bacterium]
MGPILLVSDGTNLTGLNFQTEKRPIQIQPDWQEDDAPFAEVIAQLLAYFAGERHDFELPLAFNGTEFQNAVWQELQNIPYGETTSYGELARRIGRPKAVRAVGAANGANPIPLVVPCHRVIGSNGSLTGYGGGLPIKKALLAHEQSHR